MGEYIEIGMSGGTTEAYTAGDDGPGLLFFMDAIGLRPQIEQMVDRIAAWGHVVLAPNVFWRDGSVDELRPKADLRVEGNREAFFASGVMDRVRGLSNDQVRVDAGPWIDALRARPGVDTGPVAADGYCFGGRLALLTAADRPDDVDRVAMFHTGGLVTDGPDSPHLQVPRLHATVLAGHADHDRSNTPEQIRTFDEALDAASIRHDTAVYPDAPHGYTMADTSNYDEDAAERHYRELREHLRYGPDADWTVGDASS